MAVTVSISGDVGSIFHWQIEYDDATRNITALAIGSGFGWVSTQLTNTMSRTVAFYPPAGGEPINEDLRAKMAAADFKVTIGAGETVLASNVNPNQVTRVVSKAGGVDGLNSQSQWSSR